MGMVFQLEGGMILGIVKKRNTYYFRGYIPKKLRCIINQATIDRSLKTKNKKDALRLVKHYEIQFKYLMKGFKIALENKDELYSFLDNYLNDYLLKREEHLYLSPFTLISEQIERGYFAERIEFFQYMIHDNDFKEADEFIKDALKNYSSPLDDTDILDASEHIVKRLLQQEEFIRQRAIDGYYNVSKSSTNPYFKATKTEQESNVNNSHVITQPRKTEKKPNLKEYFEDYIRIMKDERQWTKDSVSLNKTVMQSLLYEFGDTDINHLTKDNLDEYKNKLIKLPKSWGNKFNKTFNKCTTLDEIIRKNESIQMQTISLSTVSRYISVVRLFFNYYHEKDKINKNIAKKLKVFIPPRVKKKSHWSPYSIEELETLFNISFYTTQLKKNIDNKIEKVLIPIIALYSGMRLNEITSLYIDDIQKEKNIYYFNINDKKDKTTKNRGSDRRVPIHPKIIETGFLDFYDNLKSKSGGRLWLSLKKDKKYMDSDSYDDRNEGRYSKDFSSWYSRINRKYVTKDKEKVFHSFRSNVINNLKQQEESKDIIKELVGHETEDITFDTYGENYSLEIIQKLVNKIHYDVPALDVAIKNIRANINQKNTTI